jgi:hypothetical protein
VLRRYSRIMRRIQADPASASYVDDALRPPRRDAEEASEVLRVYADKIPHTHGAPRPRAVAN